MKKKHFNWLQANEACAESIGWIKQNNVQSLEEAWTSCERGDWLLWMAEHLGVDRRKLAICAALSAHTIVQYVQDQRNRDAIRVAFLWGRGKATDEQLEAAREDAMKAAADARSAFWASNTALSAIGAADDNDWAATRAAARAARTAESAAESWPDAKAARKENELRTANIARRVLTEDVLSAIQTI